MFNKKHTTVASIIDSAIADLTSVQEQQQAIANNAERVIAEQEAISKLATGEVKTASKAISDLKETKSFNQFKTCTTSVTPTIYSLAKPILVLV